MSHAAADGTAGGARAVARCDALGVPPFSDTADGLYRGYLTPAHAAALAALRDWMVQAGMDVRLDAAANLIGRYEGLGDGAALLIGSHIDSVRDAGRYDGPLGIMLGIECVAALHAAGRRLPFPIEVIAFGDEEGSRFPAAMLCSRAVAGSLEGVSLDLADAQGVTLGAALAAFRPGPQAPGDLRAARRAPPLAYLEAHIEQGPVLEAEGLPVGTVTGIAAQVRHRLTVAGRAGHAGTTPMGLRHDALAAAAAMVLAVEQVARSGRADDSLVATVGKLDVAPGAVNVIPGSATFTLDVRAATSDARDAAAAAILDACCGIADERGVALRRELVHAFAASPCDADLMDLIDASIARQGVPPLRLMSGAGHDAMTMAARCPTAMLFVRCAGGISHNPAESVDPADAAVALAAMLAFVAALGERACA